MKLTTTWVPPPPPPPPRLPIAAGIFGTMVPSTFGTNSSGRFSPTTYGIPADTGPPDAAGEQTQSKFQKFSSGMSTQAKFMAAGVGAGALSVGKELYMLGADLEQMRAKSEIVFGDQIGMVDSWAKANANAMGLTRNEAVGLSANFADLLIPMGMSREEAAKMSTEVIGLSGALSAWSGGQRSAAEVAEILQAAMLGETDSLKGLGIAISAADIEQRLLANGQAKLTGKAREQAEALAIQQLIMEKSTDAQAAFNDGVQSTNEKMAEQKAKIGRASGRERV